MGWFGFGSGEAKKSGEDVLYTEHGRIRRYTYEKPTWWGGTRIAHEYERGGFLCRASGAYVLDPVVGSPVPYERPGYGRDVCGSITSYVDWED